MGHYCRICGRIRANEKFSGKGHKNHVCKDCSGKSGRKVMKNSINENTFDLETLMPSNDALSQSESAYQNDDWFSENDLEKENANYEKDEELPF